MINVTRWSPDTCDCVLEYSWDTEVSENQREHTPLPPVSVCDDHREHPDPHASVQEENTRKNMVLQEIVKKFSSYSKLDDNGNAMPDLDKIGWAWDTNRKLKISLKTAKTAEKTALRLILNTKFGSNVDLQ